MKMLIRLSPPLHLLPNTNGVAAWPIPWALGCRLYVDEEDWLDPPHVQSPYKLSIGSNSTALGFSAALVANLG
jgi:hypothetical protein